VTESPESTEVWQPNDSVSGRTSRCSLKLVGMKMPVEPPVLQSTKVPSAAVPPALMGVLVRPLVVNVLLSQISAP